MNTELPLPERTLPPESADRIRAVIMSDEPDAGQRRPLPTWVIPLAAAVVLVALLAAGAVLWPRTSRTEVVATPSASPTLASPPLSTEPTPASTTLPSPTPAPSRIGPLDPGPNQEPFRTDRGPISAGKARSLVNECTDGKEADINKVLYARRVTDSETALDVVIYRRTGDGQEWFCAPDSKYVSLDEVNPEIGPSSSFPVVSDAGVGTGLDNRGVTAEWTFRALPSVARIQVRAVLANKPQRWFEAEVHGGLAFLPILTPREDTWDYDLNSAPLSPTSTGPSTRTIARSRSASW